MKNFNLLLVLFTVPSVGLGAAFQQTTSTLAPEGEQTNLEVRQLTSTNVRFAPLAGASTDQREMAQGSPQGDRLRQPPQLAALNGGALLLPLPRSSPEEARKASGAEEVRKTASETISALLPLTIYTSQKPNPLSIAYWDVFNILHEHNSCSDFYGGPTAALEAFNALAQRLKDVYLDHNLGIKMSGHVIVMNDYSSGRSFRLFEKAEINRNGPFYKQKIFPYDLNIPSIGGFPPNTREVRALILLHELGHLLKGADGNWLLPNDGDDETQSLKNTELVVEKCKAQIGELKHHAPPKSFPREERPSSSATALLLSRNQP